MYKLTELRKKSYLKIGVILFCFIAFNFTTAFAAVEATDANGNVYLLNDDGTYKKLETQGLSNEETATRIVSAIRTYYKIYEKQVTDEQAICIKKLVLENAGSKWVNLHFINQPWTDVSKWTETLPIKDGLVTNTMLIATGQLFILGAMEAAKQYCDLQ